MKQKVFKNSFEKGQPKCTYDDGRGGQYFPHINFANSKGEIKASEYTTINNGSFEMEGHQFNAKFIVNACNTYYERLDLLQEIYNDDKKNGILKATTRVKLKKLLL